MKIGYARVSTKDQNLDLQIEALEKAGCEKIFTDKISSIKEKKGLNEAIEYAREGDSLVIWKLDRLCRSIKDLVNVSTVLEEKGITLVSVTENIDTSTPSGRLYYSMLGAFAQLEREHIQERVNAGLKSAVARGRVLGRPKLDNRKITVAKKLLADGSTYDAVALSLNISKSTLYKYIPASSLQWDNDDE